MLSERSFELELIHVSGDVVRASVRSAWQYWVENGFSKTEAKLEFSWPGGEVSGEGWNYQVALCKARERMAQYGLTPRCFGACRNLVQTGMCVDDGAATVGYLVRLGEPVHPSRLVNIFDRGDEMELASVTEQAAFKKEWIQSIQSGRRTTA